MFSMLLPLDANAARQPSTHSDSADDVWAHWFHVSWNTIVQVFRRPRD